MPELETRAESKPQRRDIGCGWGRVCLICPTILNHMHLGPYCYQCEERIAREAADELPEAA